MGGNLVIPLNFEKNVEAFDPSTPNKNLKQRGPVLNTQTIQLCERLKIDDPISLILLKSGNPLPLPSPAKNDSAASSTFLEDTKTFNNTNSFICSPSPLSLPKPRFSLPEPRNTHEEISLDDDEDNDDDDDKEKEEKYNDLSENSLITNQSSELKTVNTPENNSADPVDMICSTPMTGKKPFKRRNESLYSNDGDE